MNFLDKSIEIKPWWALQLYIKNLVDRIPSHYWRNHFISEIEMIVLYTRGIEKGLPFLWSLIGSSIQQTSFWVLWRFLLCLLPYRYTANWIFLIEKIASKILEVNLQDKWFLCIQKIIQVFELLDIEIPDELASRWQELLAQEWENHHINTLQEQEVFDAIVNETWLYGLSISKNEYVLGFEVDIVIWDSNDKIFAIIESDGVQHKSDPKKKRADHLRDQLFYRRLITDVIIRKTKKWCQIVERTKA